MSRPVQLGLWSRESEPDPSPLAAPAATPPHPRAAAAESGPVEELRMSRREFAARLGRALAAGGAAHAARWDIYQALGRYGWSGGGRGLLRSMARWLANHWWA